MDDDLEKIGKRRKQKDLWQKEEMMNKGDWYEKMASNF